MVLQAPHVSVIISTYNRSQVLYYAIASVVSSTFLDWEVIVVGDACTDDSESVVRSFQNPRIRFFNLEKNFGDQGGPNNEGFRHARGRYIAYLSHDDLWMPDHLETAVRGIEESGADFVSTLGIAVGRNGPNFISGTFTKGPFVPNLGIPASLWLLRREVLETVGPWRHPRACVMPPSQDLLVRIWKAGKKIQPLPRVTVVAIFSGSRPGIYATRESDENRQAFERVSRDPKFREIELMKIIGERASDDASMKIGSHIRLVLVNVVRKTVRLFGVTPMEAIYFLRFRRKGRAIDRWRKTIGLSELK